MTAVTMLWGELDQSMQRVSEWVDRASVLDLRYLNDLREIVPGVELVSGFQDVITPLTDFLKEMIDQLTELLQRAFDGMHLLFEQVRQVEILERFSSLLFQGMEVIRHMADAVNTLSSEPWITLHDGGSFLASAGKIRDFLSGLTHQVPDEVVQNSMLTSIQTIKQSLQELRQQIA